MFIQKIMHFYLFSHIALSYVRYQSWTVKGSTADVTTGDTYEVEADLSIIGGGVIFGGQFIFGDIVSLEVFGGPGYNSSSLSYDSGEEGDLTDLRGDGFTFRFGATVGLAF